MTKKTQSDDNLFDIPAKNIIANPLPQEVEASFLAYAYSVIYSRALPNAADGLKPVHRRILWSMFDNGLTADKPHVKSAQVVGNVMGKLHPHGDSAIYDALVRLAQPFSLRVPLIDGHGNFGDQPGAGAAASRYTESRLSKKALLLMDGIRENSVDFIPNYDNTYQQPEVLPVKFPNLLINGAEGIAVGMATKMPTHNPGETIRAVKYLIKNPEATTTQIMKYIPGPDFPTGGTILGQDGIKEAYETGRGKFNIRGKYHIEPAGRGKNNIIFTELPYSVNAEKIIEEISKRINEGKITGVADIQDSTDMNGVRLIIETKTGINPQTLVHELFEFSSLQTSFAVNNVVLIDGNPVTANLKTLLQVFIDHRRNIITRRTQYRLTRKQERLHLVEGLLKALVDIDKVIAIVRSSRDAEIASTKLQKDFKVDAIQADYILSLQLRRLTRFDKIELDNENKKLKEEIKALQVILKNPEELTNLLVQELDETYAIINDPRRSEIVDGDLSSHIEEAKQAVKESTEIADGDCYITLHHSGLLQRTASPVKVTLRGKPDPIISTIKTTIRGNFILVASNGTGFRVESLHVFDGRKTSLKDLGFNISSKDRLVALGKDGRDEKTELGLALGTRKGVVKIVNSTDYPTRSNEFPVITLEPGDEIIGGAWASNEADLIFISNDSSLLRTVANKVRPSGARAGGVAGFKVADGANITGFWVVNSTDLSTTKVVTLTNQSIKQSLLSEYPHKGRGTGGVRSHAFRKGETSLTFALVASNPLLVAGSDTISLPELANRRDASGSPISAVDVTSSGKLF